MFASTHKGFEFLCMPEDMGIIPAPYPARKLMPEWYRNLPGKIGGMEKLDNSTIKRCAPVLDALCAGWIIPLAADVEFVSNGNASGIDYKWQFYRPMVENHTPQQLSAVGSPHPSVPKPPMKFLNWWAIRAPKGYSILFVPPLNRPDPRFECMSGLVDVDGYFEFINFPFFFNQPNYTGIIKQGTPLVQAIPIKRESLSAITPIIRAMGLKDSEDLEKTRRLRKAHESHYRDAVWKKTNV